MMPNEQKPTEIEGWEGRIRELAAEVERLQYARIQAFYQAAEDEVRAQADAIRDKNPKRAGQLEHVLYLLHCLVADYRAMQLP